MRQPRVPLRMLGQSRVPVAIGSGASACAIGSSSGEGEDALGAFLQVIELALNNVIDARTLVTPAAVYYVPISAEQNPPK